MKSFVRVIGIISLVLISYSSASNAADACDGGNVAKYHFPYFVEKKLVETSAKIIFCLETSRVKNMTSLVAEFVKIGGEALDDDAKYFQDLFKGADKYELLGVVSVGERKIAVVEFLFGTKKYTYTARLEKLGASYSISAKQNTSPIDVLFGYVFELGKASIEDTRSDLVIVLNRSNSSLNQVKLEVPQKIDLKLEGNIEWLNQQRQKILKDSPDLPVSTASPGAAIVLGEIALLFYKGESPIESEITYAIESYKVAGKDLNVFNIRYVDDIISTLMNKYVYDQLVQDR